MIPAETEIGETLKWVGVDLHVHTPASKDYRGETDEAEYSRIITRANGLGTEGQREPQESKPISAVAFTDHNSVEGFRRFRRLHEDARNLYNALRSRDAGNPLLQRLSKEIESYESVRVLLGVELKAHPGIHVLLVFRESIEPEAVVHFLEAAYEKEYQSLAGDPGPTTVWTLEQTLDKVSSEFGPSVLVIFPHAESTGGVYEDLKAYPQLRMHALKHPVVSAISFNKIETRERLHQLYSQPDYQRDAPAAFIQSSDSHGTPDRVVGQPKTEVMVPNGKATFDNIRLALNTPERIKCSVDYVEETYASSGEFVGDGERQRAVLARNRWNLRHVESNDLC
jgi:hypothetical protein